jgi:hypothetical protein|tara:strand:+ start:821 stop:1162 length:342 start_codon:yes stop_codon:yes gene_type:complete
MEILPTTGTQQLKIITRKDASNPVIKLTDKETRTTSTITPTKSLSGSYMVLDGTFTLTEDNLYSYKVELSAEDSEEIYRGLIYCTNQTNLDKYFINQNEYIEEDSFDNEYVIL